MLCHFLLHQDGKEYIPGKHECVNRCCRPNPCVNGGVCNEVCAPEGKRFNCTCPATHTGQRCEIKNPRTCKDVAINSGNLRSGDYVIYGLEGETFSVYCDMESEAGFVWTLIQSFSLANKEIFEEKGFGVDFPKNDAIGEVDWSAYRLSLSHMQSVAHHSTHLRATCNYPTEGNMFISIPIRREGKNKILWMQGFKEHVNKPYWFGCHSRCNGTN